MLVRWTNGAGQPQHADLPHEGQIKAKQQIAESGLGLKCAGYTTEQLLVEIQHADLQHTQPMIFVGGSSTQGPDGHLDVCFSHRGDLRDLVPILIQKTHIQQVL